MHGRDDLQRRRTTGSTRIGYHYVHAAIDDHTRLAYAETHPDEKTDTCAGFLRRAAAWFATHNVTIERVMTDNAMAYPRSRAWAEARADIGATPRFTRRYRPRTNGKAERLNRTMSEEGLYAQPFNTNEERAAALPQWVHTYNHHRGHTSLGGHPPISRVNNLPGHYN